MAKIEGFRVKNFGPLKDITLGSLWNGPKSEPLTPLTAVIGRNGVGKSALLNAFGFLGDCLGSGVEEACLSRGRRFSKDTVPGRKRTRRVQCLLQGKRAGEADYL